MNEAGTREGQNRSPELRAEMKITIIPSAFVICLKDFSKFGLLDEAQKIVDGRDGGNITVGKIRWFLRDEVGHLVKDIERSLVAFPYRAATDDSELDTMDARQRRALFRRAWPIGVAVLGAQIRIDVTNLGPLRVTSGRSILMKRPFTEADWNQSLNELLELQ